MAVITSTLILDVVANDREVVVVVMVVNVNVEGTIGEREEAKVEQTLTVVGLGLMGKKQVAIKTI